MTRIGRLRRRAVAVLVSATLVTAAFNGLVASPAQAFPVTTFNSDYWPHPEPIQVWTGGSFTWYNRSVEVQGQVCTSNQTTTATFEFYAGATLLDTQTRTVSYACRSFHWTQQGPVGGITVIWVYLNNVPGTISQGYLRP